MVWSVEHQRADRRSGVEVEQVQPAGVDPDLDRVARPHGAARAEARDELRALDLERADRVGGPGVDLQLTGVLGLDRRSRHLEVDHDLRPQRLRQQRRRPQATVLRHVVVGAGLGEVLRAHADRDRAIDVVADRGLPGQQLRIDREHLLTEPQRQATGRILRQHTLHHVHRRRPDEAGDEEVVGVVVEHLRRVDLQEHALAHHRHAVAHRHRLDLVVGDVDRGDAEVLLERLDVGSHLHAELRVEVRQRLVHQEHLGIADDRTPHRHPLALAAGEHPRLAVEQLGEAERGRRLVDPLGDLLLDHAAQPQAERDVVLHGHVRVQGVALEDHGDVAVAARGLVHAGSADPQLALGDVLEPGDHPEGSRLAAPRRADEHQELTVRDVEAEAADRLESVLVDLVDLVEHDVSHEMSFRSTVLPSGGPPLSP